MSIRYFQAAKSLGTVICTIDYILQLTLNVIDAVNYGAKEFVGPQISKRMVQQTFSF